MIRILDPFSYAPIIEKADKLPVPGNYDFIIIDSATREVEPFLHSEDFCKVVTYKLLNKDTFDTYVFEESYYPFKNPRTEDFSAFLESYDYTFSEDDGIIGLRGHAEIFYDVLGGFAHPMLSFRPWSISKALQGYPEDLLPF